MFTSTAALIDALEHQCDRCGARAVIRIPIHYEGTRHGELLLCQHDVNAMRDSVNDTAGALRVQGLLAGATSLI